MSTFINIQVTFDKPYQFNLLRENLTWQQLVTVIQTSILEAAGEDNLRLHYKLNEDARTLSNQDEFLQLLLSVTQDMSGLRLYGNQTNMESVYIMPRSNDSFKKLTAFVDKHYNQLESNPGLSKMVGFLAARIVYAPEQSIDEELNQIEDCIQRGATMNREEFRRMMKERKMLWKHGHRKMFRKMAHDERRNQDDEDESFEFVGSDPNKEGGECYGRRRRGHGHCRRRGEQVDLNSGDAAAVAASSSSAENEKKEKNVEHSGDNHTDNSSDSDSGNEGGRFGRRGRCGRRGKHDFFGPADAEFFSFFGGEGRHGRHGHPRHGFGGPGFGGPGFGGPGFDGPGFEGKREFGGRHHPHHYSRRDEPSSSDFDSFPHGCGRKGHHGRHGKSHDKHFGGEKYFVFN